MKIKLTTCIVGTFGAVQSGEEIERPDDEARRLIEAGYAEPVKDRPATRNTDDPKATSFETPEPDRGQGVATVATQGLAGHAETWQNVEADSSRAGEKKKRRRQSTGNIRG